MPITRESACPSGPVHPAQPVARRAGPPFRLSGRGTIILLTILAIVAVYATDQIVPATSDRQAQLRIWLAARAAGIVTFLLLTFQVSPRA